MNGEKRVGSGGQRPGNVSQRVGSGGQRAGSGGQRIGSGGQKATATGPRAGSGGQRGGSGGQRMGSGDGKNRQGSGRETPSSAGRTRPSDKLNPKTVDPFAAKASSSAFAVVYNNGGIPCRLMHGSVKHKLAWNQDPNELMFDPLIITLAEGLKETIHPYTFVAREGFKELLETRSAKEKILPVLPKVIPPLRTAVAHSDNAVFEEALQCLVVLSQATGASLNPHLKNLLSPLSKRVMEKTYKEKVMSALSVLEENGGREATLVIKAKVPTFMSAIS